MVSYIYLSIYPSIYLSIHLSVSLMNYCEKNLSYYGYFSLMLYLFLWNSRGNAQSRALSLNSIQFEDNLKLYSLLSQTDHFLYSH